MASHARRAWRGHPKDGEAKPRKQKFKTYPIGFFHIDMAEVRSEEG